ncbi:hypothetical protein LPJ61_002217, partial [Coemansia biformis]
MDSGATSSPSSLSQKLKGALKSALPFSSKGSTSAFSSKRSSVATARSGDTWESTKAGRHDYRVNYETRVLSALT